jgi:2-(1,2-epoxy-1,2-dihydrophenyl)acetyl-CoA isomerase
MIRENPEGAMDDDVHFAVEHSVGRITLNRPAAGNAITAAQRDRMLAWLDEADRDPEIRCIVLGATGRIFCAGADLRVADVSTAAAPLRVGEIRRTMREGALAVIAKILDLDKPVIAEVQGAAAGVGAHLALACDVVVAATSARFLELFVRRGLLSDGLGTWLLPRLIGLRRAKELVLFGDDLSAERAAEWGLINRVVPDAELPATVAAMAERLAAGPTLAIGANKWMLKRSLDVDRQTMAGDEAWLVEVLSRTADSEEGIMSFRERRPARFVGH